MTIINTLHYLTAALLPTADDSTIDVLQTELQPTLHLTLTTTLLRFKLWAYAALKPVCVFVDVSRCRGCIVCKRRTAAVLTNLGSSSSDLQCSAVEMVRYAYSLVVRIV